MNCVKCGKETDWVSKSGYCEACADEILKKRKPQFKWWHAVILVILLGALASAVNSYKQTSSDTERLTYLSTIAENAVKDNLKAPSTAEFPQFYKYEYIQSKEEADTYFVFGYVDAENSFGAKLRNDFAVKMRYVGPRDYEILEVIIE